jgi:peptidoglycan/xylan/chitin deacetylase (PgdA/CDA1 family)
MASPLSLASVRRLKRLFAKRRDAGVEPRGFCLGFHSICDTPVSNIGMPGVVTSPADFRSLLEEAARVAEPVSLGETRLPDAWFAVTCDDGFADNLTEALPILDELGIPAVVSPTVGFIERRVIPYELALARAIDRSNAVDGLWSLAVGANKTEKLGAYEAVRKEYKFRIPDHRAELVARLGLDEAAIRSIFDLYLTKPQLKALSEHPLITIGSHGMSHICMSATPSEQVCAEMQQSKRWIEDVTGDPCDIFVLPYGDFGSQIEGCSMHAGYRRVVTTQPNLNRGRAPTRIDRFMCDGIGCFPHHWKLETTLGRQ